MKIKANNLPLLGAGFQTCIADFPAFAVGFGAVASKRSGDAQIGKPDDVVLPAGSDIGAVWISKYQIQNSEFKTQNSNNSAFTLMEVMIAIGVFCIGVFAILGLVSSVLHGARLFDKPMVDSSVVANQPASTNSLVDLQTYSGDLSEFLGDTYKGYDYVYGINEVNSNHLYEVDITVTGDAPGKPALSKMSILLYRPLSPPGHLDFGFHQ